MLRLRIISVALIAWTSALGAVGDGPKIGDEVVVQLRSGVVIEGKLVASGETTVTISHGGAEMTLQREKIRSIGPPDEVIVLRGDIGATSQPVRISPTATPRPQPWSAEQTGKIERMLDRYFAAGDDAARKAASAELADTPLKPTAADLERMRAAGENPGRLSKHLPIPWRRGADRAWYNLTLPDGYTPRKAWPLVIALHGMPSDGDNLPGYYSNWFAKRGWIVLYPTTLHPGSWWPAPDEKRELLKLLRHVAGSYRIDYRRIYCSGGSGGGIGTWHWLTTLPELFAGGISFSAAGTIFDARLAKLKGVPFYVHHGTSDYIPIASPRKAVALARKYGADKIVFHESPGTGHTPPRKEWYRAFEWLTKLPPKDVSPRYLLHGSDDALPVGYAEFLPFAAAPDAKTCRKVVAGYKDAAGKWAIPAKVPTDLVGGLAAIGRIVDPACNTGTVRAGIDRLAMLVKARLKGDNNPVRKIAAMNEVFFQAEGFTRDATDPIAARPEGQSIARLLRTRTGSAAVLAGLYSAVGEKLGLPVRPVVTPYHVFVRYDDARARINIEMAEAGGSFADDVYLRGYGLGAMPDGKQPATEFLARQLAVIGAMARKAGQSDKASAAAVLASGLHADDCNAIMLAAALDEDHRRFRPALAKARRAGRLQPAYAAPKMTEGRLLATLGDKAAAVRAYRAAIAAAIKPHGQAKAYDAEMHFRIAEIYAPLARAARNRNSPSALRYTELFHKHIVECLRNNRSHAKARKLFSEMGGTFVKRSR